MPLPKIIHDGLRYKRTITIEVVCSDPDLLEKEAFRAREICHLGGIVEGRQGNVRIKQEDGVIDRTGKYIPNCNLGK
jgi:hypothetical protein